MTERYSVQWSVDTLCGIVSYAPSRVALAFVAAQPRCRIAAELHTDEACCGTAEWGAKRGGLLDPADACGEVDAAWTAWAAQLPFDEWWMSHVAHSVMPSDAPPLREMCFEEGTASSLRRIPSPSPPPLPLVLPPSASPTRCAPASAFMYMTQYNTTYRTYTEHRTATIAKFQSGVLQTPDAAEVAWADCPYPGERLWCLSVKGGYIGGVIVGHLVSFLVPVSRQEHATDATTAATWKEMREGVHSDDDDDEEDVLFRRVLHWDVGTDELHRQRTPCRSEDTARRSDAGTASATPAPSFPSASHLDRCDESSTDAEPKSSWSLSHWWFCRPLCLSRTTISTRAMRLMTPRCTPGVADASLYVYGSHPASLASHHLRAGCSVAVPHGTLTAFDSSCPKAASNSPLLHVACGCRCCPQHACFLTSIHFCECRSGKQPAPVAAAAAVASTAHPLYVRSSSSHSTPSLEAGQVVDRLQRWCLALCRVPCCSRLTRLEVNLEGCVSEKVDVSPWQHEESIPTEWRTDSTAVQTQSLFVPDELTEAPEAGADPCRCAPPFLAAPPPPPLPVDLLTEVRISESNLDDVNFLGTLPHLLLADVAMNPCLADAGVEGVARSTSLRVLNLSYCPLVDRAAAPLAAIATLEEMYLSGTGLTDATMRIIANQQRQQQQDQQQQLQQQGASHWHHRCRSAEAAEKTSGVPPRVLRVLHVDGCRHLLNPLKAFTRGQARLPPSLTSAEAHGEEGGLWAGLVDFRASAASRRPKHVSHDEDFNVGDEDDTEDNVTPTTASSDTTDMSEGSRRGAAFTPWEVKQSGVFREARSMSFPVQEGTPPLPLLVVCNTLSTLELHNVVFHCTFKHLGELRHLQRLLLQRCSVAEAQGRVHHRAGHHPHHPVLAQQEQHEHQHRPLLEGLERCSSLHTVSLEECDARCVEGDSLRVLAQLPLLQNVSLQRAHLRDADVKEFVDALHEHSFLSPSLLPLQQLSLGLCSGITRISTVATLTAVRVLDLSDTSVQQDLIDLLGGCSTQHQYPSHHCHALRVLKLAACAFIVNANPLATLPALQYLDLSHTPVTTAGMSKLRHCRALTHLNLKGCAGIQHLHDVMCIPTLQVLNAQGTGLTEEAARAGVDSGGHRSHDFAGPDNTAVACNTPGSAAAYHDVYPPEDARLRRSSLHTLLLSHTRVRRISRLGLLPSLTCLDLSSTCVTDVELAGFVCTGLCQGVQGQSRLSQLLSSAAASGDMEPERQDALQQLRADAAGSTVVHSLHALCAVGAALPSSALLPHPGQSPPLRVLSLQLCRCIFTVGVLGLCPRLTKLDLSASNVTGRGLIGLHRSRQLMQLRLAGCKGVHDVRALAHVASLREVDGSGCNVHSDRLIGCAYRTAGDGSDPLSDAPVAVPPSYNVLTFHSDLFHGQNFSDAEASALQSLVEGASSECSDDATPSAAHKMTFSFATPSPPLLPLCASQLRRLVLDGCVNMHDGLAALGRLPALMELSLRNCPGITDSSIAQLMVEDQRAGEPSPERRRSFSLFPALRSLHLSFCRLLTGSLRGLEKLPQLQHVDVDQCGIVNLAEVVPALRSRVAL
jgi:Leucine-rich repeat (LRR) protein